MVALEQHEFKKMVGISVAVHGAILVMVFISTSMSTRRFIEIGSQKPMSVMWARTVQSPKATPKNKLPGPNVPLQRSVTKSKVKPKIVMPTSSSKKQSQAKKKQEEEEARERAMAKAIASVRQDIEKRPIPRADNFPSTGEGERGLPGGPRGIGGSLVGNPVFSSYKNQIRKIITDNFVWIQKREKLHSEVTFTIDMLGNIVKPSIYKTSGNFAYDRAALRAVQKSSPLPQPPKEIARDVTIESFVVNFDPKLR